MSYHIQIWSDSQIWTIIWTLSEHPLVYVNQPSPNIILLLQTHTLTLSRCGCCIMCDRLKDSSCIFSYVLKHYSGEKSLIKQSWLSVRTLNTETIPSDSEMVLACLISSVLRDGKVNQLSLDLQQVPARPVFRTLSPFPIPQVGKGTRYDVILVQVQVGNQIS